MKKATRIIKSLIIAYLITGIVIGIMFVVAPEFDSSLMKTPFPVRLLFIPYSIIVWAFVVGDSVFRILSGISEGITIQLPWCLCFIAFFLFVFAVCYNSIGKKTEN